LQESFPFVRVFGSVEGWGDHFLASMTAIPSATPEQLAQRLPSSAARDLIAWGPSATPEEQFRAALAQEIPLSSIVQKDSNAPALQDDRPVNEYFLIRRFRDPVFWKKVGERFLGRVAP
jgi:hypothetical protein